MNANRENIKDYDYKANPLGDYNPKGTNLGEQLGFKVIGSESLIPIEKMNAMYDMIEKGENSIPALMKFIEEIDIPWRMRLFFALQVGLQFDKINMRKLVEEVHETTNQATNMMMNIAKNIENGGFQNGA